MQDYLPALSIVAQPCFSKVINHVFTNEITFTTELVSSHSFEFCLQFVKVVNIKGNYDIFLKPRIYNFCKT